MVDILKYETPLADKKINNSYLLASNNFEIKEYTNKSFMVIRGQNDDHNFLNALISLNLKKPLVGKMTDNKLLWISPDEYLLILPAEEKDAFKEKAKEALKDTFSAVVDNSGTYSMLGLQGKKSIFLLQKISWINFNINSFKVGTVYSSQIGKAPAIFIRKSEEEIILLIRFSYAEYIYNLITNAEKEYQ